MFPLHPENSSISAWASNINAKNKTAFESRYVCLFLRPLWVSISVHFSLCDSLHRPLHRKSQTWHVCLGGLALCLCVWSVWLTGVKRGFQGGGCLCGGLFKHTIPRKSLWIKLPLPLSHTSLLLPLVNICSVWLYLTLKVNSPALTEN